MQTNSQRALILLTLTSSKEESNYPECTGSHKKNLCLIAARAEQPAFYVIKLKAPRGALQISRKHTFTPPRARHSQTKSEAVNKQELLVLTLRTVEARTDGSCHMLI